MHSLLVFGAHPDDETMCAGTMALYVRRGIRVGVVCGTRGERGSTADLCSIPELPKVREAELRSSMRVLGLRDEDVFFLPYEDQKLHLAPGEEIRGHLVRTIRSFRPTVAVGFDPHGANGHTDHVAMTKFVADALAAAGDARFHPEAGSAHDVSRMLWLSPIAPWRADAAINLSSTPGIDFVIDTSSVAAIKAAAVREHRTQFPGLGTLYFERNSPDLTLNKEMFRIGWGVRPARVPATDLFDGL